MKIIFFSLLLLATNSYCVSLEDLFLGTYNQNKAAIKGDDYEEELFEDSKKIETEHLNLNPLATEDAEALAELFKNQGIEEPQNTSWECASKWVNTMLAAAAQKKAFVWTASLKENSEIIGFIGLDAINADNRTATIIRGFLENYKNVSFGYFDEAINELKSFGFSKLGLNRIVFQSSIITDRLERLGFSYDGAQRIPFLKNPNQNENAPIQTNKHIYSISAASFNKPKGECDCISELLENLFCCASDDTAEHHHLLAVKEPKD